MIRCSTALTGDLFLDHDHLQNFFVILPDMSGLGRVIYVAEFA